MKKGFTLVELAIVIVIIGLLVGGVLQGQELVQQARLRSFIKSLEGYEAAMIVFKDTYKCIPGDCNNASTVLDASAYNGDGNGVLLWVPGSTSETFYIWQHLGLSGLIKGSYTGEYSATKGLADLGVNIPKVAGFDSAGLLFLYRTTGTTLAGGLSTFGKHSRYLFVAGGSIPYPGVINANYGGFLDAASAYQVDSKLDDGNPGGGNINSNNGFGQSSPVAANSCTTSLNTTAFDGTVPTEYNLASTRIACVLVIWRDLF